MANHETEANQEWTVFEARASASGGIRTKQTARNMLKKMREEGVPNDKDLLTTISILERTAKPGPKPVDSAELKRQVIAARVKMLKLLSDG